MSDPYLGAVSQFADASLASATGELSGDAIFGRHGRCYERQKYAKARINDFSKSALGGLRQAQRDRSHFEAGPSLTVTEAIVSRAAARKLGFMRKFRDP